jgi:hypothetical protein
VTVNVCIGVGDTDIDILIGLGDTVTFWALLAVTCGLGSDIDMPTVKPFPAGSSDTVWSAVIVTGCTSNSILASGAFGFTLTTAGVVE